MTKKLKTYDKRWVSTYSEYVWVDDRYVKIKEDGYWYSGPTSLASTPPNWTLTNWSFFQDGTESGASQSPFSTNTNPTKGQIEVDTIYLVRFDIEEDSGNESKNTTLQLQYSLNSGTATDVNATSSVVQMAGTGSGLTDAGDTSAARLGGTYTYDSTNEGQCEIDGLAGGGTADLNNTGCEMVFAFKVIGADVSEDDTIELSVVPGAVTDDATPTFPSSWPTITVPAGAATATVAADAAQVEAAAAATVTADTNKTVTVAAAISQVTATTYIREVAEKYCSLRAGTNDIGEQPMLTMSNVRTTDATVEAEYGDADIINKYVRKGEIRFPGARYTNNLSRIDIQRWSAIASDVTITPGYSDPDGNNNAYRIAVSTGSRWIQDYSPDGLVPEGFYVRNSMWLRRVSGTGAVRIYTGNYSDTQTITLTGSWQRFSPAQTVTTLGAVNIGVLITTAGDSIDIYYPKCELVHGPQFDQTRPSETVWWWDESRNFNPDPGMTLGGMWFYISGTDTTFKHPPGSVQVDGSLSGSGTAHAYIGLRDNASKIDHLIPDGGVIVCRFTVSGLTYDAGVTALSIRPNAKTSGGTPAGSDSVDLIAHGNGTYVTQPIVTTAYSSGNFSFVFYVVGTTNAAADFSLKISDVEIYLANTNCNSAYNGYYFDKINANTVNGSYVVTENAGTTLLPKQSDNIYLRQGLLAEPQRTNILTYSEDGTNSNWTKDGVTAAIASDVSGIVETRLTSINTTSDVHEIYQTYASDGVTKLALSSYAEPSNLKYFYMVAYDATSADYTAVFFDVFGDDSDNVAEVRNTVTSGTSITLVTGSDFCHSTKWAGRCGFVVNLTSATNGHNIIVSYGFSNSSTSTASSDAGAPSIAGWLGGMQCEQHDDLVMCSSYIKTEASAVTRNSDLVRYRHGR